MLFELNMYLVRIFIRFYSYSNNSQVCNIFITLLTQPQNIRLISLKREHCSQLQLMLMEWRGGNVCQTKQPISVVLNRDIRFLNTYESVTRKVTNIHKTQKILQLKDIYHLEASKFMYKYTNSQLPAIFNNDFKLITDVRSYIRDKPKFGNLLYQKHDQTQVRKC